LYSGGKKFVIRPENFKDDEDYEVYFDRVYEDYKQRTLQEASTPHLEDYADVFYWPYESLLKVNTEVCSRCLSVVYSSPLLGLMILTRLVVPRSVLLPL
jgi:hypothetical protein